ncbi:hypothetical protein PWT90_01097 [Aphanocladium album]|nr:hypothetical protein PWT90_01097 [Aphanocladium album]
MRKAFRGLIGRERRTAENANANERPVDRASRAVEGLVIAEATVQQPVEPPAQPLDTASVFATETAAETENEANVSEDLWARAYRALSEREPELVNDYAKHVEAGGGDAHGALANPDSVKALVKALQDGREKSQWKFSIRSKDHKVSDQLEKFIKLLALADGVVKQALSSQPYAALAWSTVSVFVPLLSGGFAQNQALVTGFTTVGELQEYWKRYEEIYLLSASSEHYKNFALPLSNVYSYMLEYQIRAVCHLSKKQLSRAWQKVAGDNDWVAKEAHVVKLSDRCLANIAPLQREEMAQSLTLQNAKLESIRETEEKILDTMKDHRQKDAEGSFLRALKSTAGNYKGGMEFNADSVKGTCEWFFADEGFSGWRDAPGSGVFWLTAGPGCGKSVLARTLVKDGHLKTTETTVDVGSSTVTSAEATVCYFFFKDEEIQRTKITTALCALLHQLFSQKSTRDLIEHALPDFEAVGDSLTDSFEELWGILATCADTSTSGDIICVLDAFDECNEEGRAKLIRELDNYYDSNGTTSKAKVKFFITSRPYYDIVTSFRPLSKGAQYFRFDADERHQEISHDIGLVIDAELETFAGEFDAADRRKIEETLKSKGTKTYLWLHLTLRIMKADPDQYSRRRDVDALLADVPAEVSEAYEKILRKAKNERITSTLLQILLGALRPLAVEEANYALALALEENGFETHAQLEAECWKVDFGAIVKNFSGLLISVYDGKLSFIHLTASEYLMRKPEPTLAATKWGGRFADFSPIHELMSRCCMQYLLLSELSSRALPLLSTAGYPLLGYAANHWPEHFKKQDNNAQEKWIEQAIKLSRTSGQPLKVWGYIYFSDFRSLFGWTDLTLAAYLGLLKVVSFLVNDQKVDLNEPCAEYGSALSTAVASREMPIAEFLISRGADVNAVWEFGGTPLMIAAGNSDTEAISLLLANGASPLLEFLQRRYSKGTTTVLYETAFHEDSDIFRLLVSSIADISTPDKILVAMKQENIVRCGEACVSRLMSLLPYEALRDEAVLSPKILASMLDRNDTYDMGLRLVIQQNKQHLLLEEPLLSLALHRRSGKEIVYQALQQQGQPCAGITKELIMLCIERRDLDTVKILAQYCLAGTFEARDMFLAAGRIRRNSRAVYDAVVEITGDALFKDVLVQELLLKASSAGAIYTFLRLPMSTPEATRHLMRTALRLRFCRLEPGEYPNLLKNVLRHCAEERGIIDMSILKEAARRQDRETVQLLLDLYNSDEPAAKSPLLEAAASNSKDGKSIMSMLLRDAGSGADITPDVLAAATADNLDWLLKQYGHQLVLTTDVLLYQAFQEEFETILKWKADEVTALAPVALQRAVEDRHHHNHAIQHLIPHCSNLLAGASEDFILSLLEGPSYEFGDVCMMILDAAGDALVFTERIVATCAAQPQLLDLIRGWRPSDLKVTISLIAMIAAGGHIESLDYLAKCDDQVTIGDEWYRLARFHHLAREASSADDLDVLREVLGDGAVRHSIAEATDANGMTALHRCVYQRGQAFVMSFLVDEAKVLIDAVDLWGWTALHYAVRGLEPDIVQLLIDAGANPHKADLQGRTPTTLAQGCILRGSVCKDRYCMDANKLTAVLNGEERLEGDEHGWFT